MKFARFEYDGMVFYGTVRGDEITVIDGSIFGGYRETDVHYGLDMVRLLPPVEPSKIVCIGQNYIGHIKELGVTPPKKPLFFLKPPSSLIGPKDAIVYPKSAERVDYEGELAVVIGKTMKNVSRRDALPYVLGYSCFNDVTERKLAAENPFNLTLSKSFDTFSALGPYVVTDIDGNNARLRTFLNGVLMQDDNTRNCVFDIAYLLEYLSHCLTLCQGDIVTTGTPKGIAPMKPGDVVEVEIEGIGKLSNVIESER